MQAGSTSPGPRDSSAQRPPRAPVPSALRSQMRSSRVAPLPPPISVIEPPAAAPERASLSAPTSPVGRRTRTAAHAQGGLRPPVAPLPAAARLPQLQASAMHGPCSGVGEAVAQRQPRSRHHIGVAQDDRDTARPAAQHAPSTQQPLWWLSAGAPPDAVQPPSMLDVGPPDAAAKGRALPPLAVEQASLPSSPIAAGASPVWTGAAAGLDVTATLLGGAAAEERDVSEEFDVAILIGDLNYRCVRCPLLLQQMVSHMHYIS